MKELQDYNTIIAGSFAIIWDTSAFIYSCLVVHKFQNKKCLMGETRVYYDRSWSKQAQYNGKRDRDVLKLYGAKNKHLQLRQKC